MSLKLGVNVDHVATLRQARRAALPDPVEAALLAESAGAQGITAHLREDRRHINDDDLRRLAKSVKRLNMEMAVTDEMVRIACSLKPACCCLVPEKRAELTTEGGLDVAGQMFKVKSAVEKLKGAGVVVSLFIDPDERQIIASAKSGADFVELHTGSFANASGVKPKTRELERLVTGASVAEAAGLRVNAGHGIDYDNIKQILHIPHMVELNIGHSIIARAVITGLFKAVKDMVDAMERYRG